MIHRRDTIAALSSPPGAGACGIVRLSGPDAERIARALCGDPALPEGPGARAALPAAVRLHGLAAPVHATLYFMRAPRSYTREDVAELHLPGSPAILDAALEACFRAGARPAGPGEFTLRAFRNGRIGLAQAEAVNRLIRARDEASRRAAVLAMRGRLDREADRLSAALARALARIEARLDFADQDLPPEAPASVLAPLREADGAVARLLAEDGPPAESGRPLVLLAGRVNAGKSSLFNALAGQGLSLVSAHPGTTRDVVSAEVRMGGVAALLADPAGIGGDPGPVGRKARAAFEQWLAAADLAILVLDGSAPPGAPEEELLSLCAGKPLLRVLNKADLGCSWSEEDARRFAPGAPRVSALLGGGVEALRREAGAALASGLAPRGGEGFGAGPRQRRALEAAREGIGRAIPALERGEDEIAALELREAIEALGRLSGRGLSESVLETIFSEFCVGK
jgi:tRNA modification GTPase